MSAGAPLPSPPVTIASQPGVLSRLSLRSRLLVVIVALLVAALTAIGGLTAFMLKDQLTSRVDEQLIRLSQGDSGPTERDGDRHGPGGALVISGEKLPNGNVYFSLPGPLAKATGGETPLPSTISNKTTGPHTVQGTNGGNFRVVTVKDGCGDDCTTIYASPLTDAQTTFASVMISYLLIAVAVIGLATLLGYYAIGRAFRPLREVESVAQAFGDGDTTRRVDGVAPGTEVGRLGGSVNQMLDQIETTLAAREASEQRMRRFVGDASHELRTPLSTLRGFAELYRMGAVTGQENISATFKRIEDESTRMSGLVEDLLRLARLDEKRPLNLTSVDLLVLAADAETDAQALAPDRQVRITGLDGAGDPGAALVTGDEQQLRQVVTNLLANSLRHTPEGTPVQLAVGSRGEEAIFQVIDHGHGVPPELAEKIFERFYRTDESRSRGAGGGSGLGLAIVSAIVAAHGGSARVVPTPGGGATFEVRIPRRDPVTTRELETSTAR